MEPLHKDPFRQSPTGQKERQMTHADRRIIRHTANLLRNLAFKGTNANISPDTIMVAVNRLEAILKRRTSWAADEKRR